MPPTTTKSAKHHHHHPYSTPKRPRPTQSSQAISPLRSVRPAGSSTQTTPTESGYSSAASSVPGTPTPGTPTPKRTQTWPIGAGGAGSPLQQAALADEIKHRAYRGVEYTPKRARSDLGALVISPSGESRPLFKTPTQASVNNTLRRSKSKSKSRSVSPLYAATPAQIKTFLESPGNPSTPSASRKRSRTDSIPNIVHHASSQPTTPNPQGSPFTTAPTTPSSTRHPSVSVPGSTPGSPLSTVSAATDTTTKSQPKWKTMLAKFKQVTTGDSSTSGKRKRGRENLMEDVIQRKGVKRVKWGGEGDVGGGKGGGLGGGELPVPSGKRRAESPIKRDEEDDGREKDERGAKRVRR